MQQKKSHFSNVFEALETNNLSVLKKALQNGIDINKPDKNGNHALFFADIEQCRLLIAAGADINYLDSEGRNALFYCDSISESLMLSDSYNEKSDEERANFIVEQAKSKLRFLTESGMNIHQKDIYGNNLYKKCCDMEMVNFLLSHNVDYTGLNNNRESILWYFAGVNAVDRMLHSEKSLECLVYFLEKGLDPHINNMNGENILFAINEKSKFDVLAQYDVDINLINVNNENILNKNLRILDSDFAIFLIEKGVRTDIINRHGLGVIAIYCQEPLVLLKLLEVDNYTPVQFSKTYYEDCVCSELIEDLRLKSVAKEQELLRNITKVSSSKKATRL